MFKQRVITAIVLLAILIPAIFYPTPSLFFTIALVLIGAGAWEWGRLNACSHWGSWVVALACVVLCALFWAMEWIDQSLFWIWCASGPAWVLLSAWVLTRGVFRWLVIPKNIRLIAGVVMLCLAWLSVVQARVIGINFLFSVFAVVWVADIAAYFSGKAFSGWFFERKLAPSISPGKSWEGGCGAFLGVMVLALIWVTVETSAGYSIQTASLYSRLVIQRGWFVTLLSLIFLTTMSIVGDLFESLVKRSAGVKDSSGLLPGHGGVLDRIDALLPVLPLAMMLVSF